MSEKKLEKVLDSLISHSQRAMDAYREDNNEAEFKYEMGKRDAFILIRDTMEYKELLKHLYQKFVKEDEINETV